MVVPKVVNIVFWLVKSYKHVLRVESLEKIKNGWNRVKSLKSDEIAWNRAKSRFQDRFCDCNKMMRWNKIPPHGPAVRRLLAVEMHSHATHATRSSGNQVTLHNSQKTLSFYLPNKSLIG
jgi:hypothetical protein